MSSPYINHFIQPDSVIPDQGDPQSWNRYSYVQNNPIRYNDPTGHCLAPGTQLACPIQLSNPPGLVSMALELLLLVTVAVVGEHITEQVVQQNYPHEKRIMQIESTYGQTTDNGLPPGIKLPNCGKICQFGAAVFAAVIACVNIFDEKCTEAVTPHETNLNDQIPQEPICGTMGPCYINKNPEPICGSAETCYVNKSPKVMNPLINLPPTDFSNPSLTISNRKPNFPPLSLFEKRLLNKGLLE